LVERLDRVNITTPIDQQTARRFAPEADAWLAERAEASLLIDSIGHRIIAANGGGASALGYFGTQPLQLDPAMPGWAILKAATHVGPEFPPRTEPVLFWTPLGPRILTGRVETVRRGDQALVLFTLMPVGAGCAAREPGPAGVAQTSNDLATLREIARRIRAGTGAPLTSTADPATLADGAVQIALEGAPRLPEHRSAAAKANVNPTSGAPRLTPAPLDFCPPTHDAAPAALAPNKPSPANLAKLAHELRTPLSAIVSLAEIMRDERLGQMGNARYKSYAADIHDSALHTLELITAMTQAPPADTRGGPPQLSHSKVDLNELVRSCASSMRPIATRGHTTLITDLAPAQPQILADRRAVRQIIFNLLANALRFTPSNGFITLTTLVKTCGSVRMSVTDTGPGMAPAEIDRVLAENTDTNAQSAGDRQRANGCVNTGIGLPLVRDLVDAHDSLLAIDSGPGRGTSVMITFPKSRVIRP
jgi:two-component system, cell cycle sensor histidine kinase PleC